MLFSTTRRAGRVLQSSQILCAFMHIGAPAHKKDRPHDNTAQPVLWDVNDIVP